jgi:hypothetical protein
LSAAYPGEQFRDLVQPVRRCANAVGRLPVPARRLTFPRTGLPEIPVSENHTHRRPVPLAPFSVYAWLDVSRPSAPWGEHVEAVLHLRNDGSRRHRLSSACAELTEGSGDLSRTVARCTVLPFRDLARHSEIRQEFRLRIPAGTGFEVLNLRVGMQSGLWTRWVRATAFALPPGACVRFAEGLAVAAGLTIRSWSVIERTGQKGVCVHLVTRDPDSPFRTARLRLFQAGESYLGILTVRPKLPAIHGVQPGWQMTLLPGAPAVEQFQPILAPFTRPKGLGDRPLPGTDPCLDAGVLPLPGSASEEEPD